MQTFTSLHLTSGVAADSHCEHRDHRVVRGEEKKNVGVSVQIGKNCPSVVWEPFGARIKKYLEKFPPQKQQKSVFYNLVCAQIKLSVLISDL